MRLVLSAAAATALFACGSPAADGKEAELKALIAALEKKVPLPDASRSLAGYNRYYAISGDEVSAVYVAAPSDSGRVHLVQAHQLPQAKAEGCSVVSLVFDRARNSFERVLCNPVRLAQLSPEEALGAPALPEALGAASRAPSGGERG